MCLYELVNKWYFDRIAKCRQLYSMSMSNCAVHVTGAHDKCLAIALLGHIIKN